MQYKIPARGWNATHSYVFRAGRTLSFLATKRYRPIPSDHRNTHTSTPSPPPGSSLPHEAHIHLTVDDGGVAAMEFVQLQEVKQASSPAADHVDGQGHTRVSFWRRTGKCD